MKKQHHLQNLKRNNFLRYTSHSKNCNTEKHVCFPMIIIVPEFWAWMHVTFTLCTPQDGSRAGMSACDRWRSKSWASERASQRSGRSAGEGDWALGMALNQGSVGRGFENQLTSNELFESITRGKTNWGLLLHMWIFFFKIEMAHVIVNATAKRTSDQKRRDQGRGMEWNYVLSAWSLY